jgi:hypothetical protein
MTLESGIALCDSLVSACPKSMPDSVKKSAKKLKGAAGRAQTALAKRQAALGTISEEDARVIDQEGDVSWGALRGRLTAYASLPVKQFPDAKRAGELIIALFGEDGLSFLKETYPVQWGTADTILLRIQNEGLQADIDRIAGPEFLKNVRARHVAYGAMVKRYLARNSSATVNLGDEVRKLGRAIVAYATQVCAFATDKEDDDDALAAAADALRPLDVFRELAAARARSEQGTAEPPGDPAAEPPKVG